MKIRCGDMYMVRLDHPSNVYGWSVSRTWWMPWRYDLHLCYILREDEVLRCMTKDGLKGTLKLMDLWRNNE